MIPLENGKTRALADGCGGKQLLSGTIKDLDIDDSATVADLKQKIMEDEGIPPVQQRIVFQGKNMFVFFVFRTQRRRIFFSLLDCF
jgi:hypothetical protein